MAARPSKHSEYYSEYGRQTKENNGILNRIAQNNVFRVFDQVNRVVGCSTILFCAYKFGKRILQRNNPKIENIGQESAYIKLEDEVLQKLKSDNEEIWNAILNLHNAQSELKDEVEKTSHEKSSSDEEDGNEEVKEAMYKSLDKISKDIDRLTTRVDLLENDFIEMTKKTDDQNPESSYALKTDVEQLIELNNKSIIKKLILLKNELVSVLNTRKKS